MIFFLFLVLYLTNFTLWYKKIRLNLAIFSSNVLTCCPPLQTRPSEDVVAGGAGAPPMPPTRSLTYNELKEACCRTHCCTVELDDIPENL